MIKYRVQNIGSDDPLESTREKSQEVKFPSRNVLLFLLQKSFPLRSLFSRVLLTSE